ncbi:odorant receptor Or2-like isoform X1 [Neodiprion fabricii]|uniref:odorant receptor Or2-like isoform X1 n=1 Tax=Neodiprion fabricii TaxID=2872261 RepID=UPI001ED8C610|nr:odorant receptor Or2-like isoform X1 [Neodiprion fabricii]XP_046420778.1 odorant receptor Or2-like isoform X1 [Neodiprion fabricii]
MKTLSVDTSLRLARVLSTLILLWPLAPDAKRSEVIRRRSLTLLSLAHIVVTFPTMILGTLENMESRLDMFIGSTDMIAVGSLILYTGICYIEETRLHGLITEMTSFMKEANDEELAALQFYMKKCSLLHMGTIVVAFSIPVSYILSPLIQDQPLPGRTAYPFSIEPLWIYIMLFISHSVIIIQIQGAICMTITFVVLTWFGAVKFDMVCMYINKATTETEVKKCAERHQESIHFANRLSTSVGRMAFGVATSNLLGVIFGGVVMTYRKFDSIDFFKLMIFMMIVTIHLFLYAWPADYLAQSSQRVAESILNGKWVGKSPRMHSSLLLMMERANNPAIIKVDGVLPPLNLEMFGSGLSTSFSYIATLFAIFDE